MTEGFKDLIIVVNKLYDENNPEFLASAHNAYDNGALKLIAEHLIDRQIQHSVTDAEDWQRVLFNRATINGIQLIIEEFEALEAKYQELHQPPDSFNKHEVV